MHDVTGASRASLFPAVDRMVGDAPKGLVVAIPLYKGPDLLARLAAALATMADELRALRATVMFINDSPDHGALSRALAIEVPKLAAALDVEVVTNPSNLGFVHSTNRAMRYALESGQDVLLLNSDTLPRPGAFAEMAAVAYLDPMIGAVSPRSDNATICDSPYLDALRTAGPDEAYAAHQQIARHLPRYTYVPTTVGFCMYVRWLILREFGLLDPIYGAGYNEENDFVRRFNQCGYRAVLANHAYVNHIGHASFAKADASPEERDAANRTILFDRYPETPRLIQRYFEGAEYRAQRLLGGLVRAPDGRLRLSFDCRQLGCYHSGTQEHLFELLKAFAAANRHAYDIHAICEEEAYRFHALDTIAGVSHCSEEDALQRPSAVLLRIGQPFKLAHLRLLEEAAPVTGVLMLDTIALDCQQLDDTGLETLWQRMSHSIDLLGFNSCFSRDQFNRRFAVPDRVRQFVSRCSTDIRDYAAGPVTPPGDEILVVGNHFPHKYVRETVAALRRAEPACRIIVLGVDAELDDVECHVAGLLSEELVFSLYERARVVLLPSHYEGFGLPILHGLARARPVVARDLPSAHEIRALCPQAVNLHLAATTDEMVRLALRLPAWIDVPADSQSPYPWAVAAREIATAIDAAIAGFDFATCRDRQASATFDQFKLEAQQAAEPQVPGLPRLGQGYMLGRDLERELATCARATWRERLRTMVRLRLAKQFDVSRDVPHGIGRPRFLNLRVDASLADLRAIQTGVLRWVAALRVGGLIRLQLPAAIMTSEDLDPPTAARVILLGSGVSVQDVVEEKGILVVTGTKRSDWKAMLPGPEEDLHFVHFLYRQMLGRHPDKDGEANYLREQERGCQREELLLAFLSSPERQALIGHHLRREQRPQSASA